MIQEEYNNMKKLHDKHWYFLGKKNIINHFIQKYKHNPVVLDIGCGDGYFFDKYSGIGIEPCDLFKGENIINKPIEFIELNTKFDVILALDVIEHLSDDKVIYKFIDENLNEDGIAIITVPAHRKLFNEHDIAHNHFRRYDKVDLENLLKPYNTEIYYYNSILYPIAYIIRKITKGKNNLKLGNTFVNKILKTIFSFEKYTYKYHVTGMSLIAIIKK